MESPSATELRPSSLGPQLRVLIVDNYDSFAYNLYQRVGELTGAVSTVVRNDKVSIEDIERHAPTHIILSPGPGTPENPKYFGICREVILRLGVRTPLFGVCLGHQGIGHAFGGRVVRAQKVMHGKTSVVIHDGTHLFWGLEPRFVAMRYHSLVLEPAEMPTCLTVTARTEDGVVMGIRHNVYPIHGVQFHPESIGTPSGTSLLRNFLEMRA